MNRGIPLIVSGPSGSGKDFLLSHIFRMHPEIKFSISCVTRSPRGSEAEDGKYHFVTTDEFKIMMENNELLEYNVYLGNYYGTPREPVESALSGGSDIVLEIDVNGAEKIRKALPEAVSIFIMPPSMQVLKERLTKRNTEDEETAKKRLNEAVTEISRAHEFDYIVINDDVDDAAFSLCAIIKSEKAKTGRMKKYIEEVLENAESCDW